MRLSIAKRLVPVVAAAVVGVFALPATPATAATVPPSCWDIGLVGPLINETQGTATWLNRSVTLQGSVQDTAGTATVLFVFDQNNTEISRQTRTASDEKTPFHFTADGSHIHGGINRIVIALQIDGVDTYGTTLIKGTACSS